MTLFTTEKNSSAIKTCHACKLVGPCKALKSNLLLLRKIIIHTTKWLPCNSSKKCGSSFIMKCDYNRSWRKIFRIFLISAAKNKKVFMEGWKSKYMYTCTCRSAACLTATPLLQSPCYYSHFNYYSDFSKGSVSPSLI